MRFKFLNIALILAFVIWFVPLSLQAQETKSHAFDYEYFESLPVLHEGRLKPLQSFAILHFRWFKNQSHVSHDEAMSWLTSSLFDPQSAAQTPLFKIDLPELENSILAELENQGISKQKSKKHLYSVADLTPYVMARRPNLSQDELSVFETAYKDLHAKYGAAIRIMQTMSLYLPMNVQIPNKFKETISLPNQEIRVIDLHAHEQFLSKELKSVIKEKGDDIPNYTTEEQKLAQLLYAYHQLFGRGISNDFVKLYPDFWQDGSYFEMEWLSPWQQFSFSKGHPKQVDYIQHWQDMSQAFRNNNQAAFFEASKHARDFIFEAEQALNPSKLENKTIVEIFYNDFQPLELTMILYLISIIFVLCWFKWPKRVNSTIAEAGLILGAVSHALALILRGIILERPPVTTLYESVIFVAITVVLVSLIFFYRSKNYSHILYGAIGGLILLVISSVFLSQEDSLQMLVAVLNTNFWLAVHDLMITAGYGLCVLAAIMAHGWLGYGLVKTYDDAYKTKRDVLFKQTYFITVLALLITTIGTVLGGIWADQSWGRFWGWDPKENGALLIVLWLAWIIHGRLAGIFGKELLMYFIGYLNIVVGLAWFGVNLLGVGLHSYGFTSGIAVGLIAFVIVEILILSTLLFFNKRRV